MLTHVVPGPIRHAFSEPKQGRPDNEIEPDAIAERDKAQSLYIATSDQLLVQCTIVVMRIASHF